MVHRCLLNRAEEFFFVNFVDSWPFPRSTCKINELQSSESISFSSVFYLLLTFSYITSQLLTSSQCYGRKVL